MPIFQLLVSFETRIFSYLVIYVVSFMACGGTPYCTFAKEILFPFLSYQP